MARDIPSGTAPGMQSPTNRTTISTFNEWMNGLTVCDWAWWDIYEYDQEEFRYGPCNESLTWDVSEERTWSVTADSGTSMSGAGGLSGKSGNAGIQFATSQSFGYAQTGAISITLMGEVPARSGYRPVLIIQYRVREYNVDYYDYGWFGLNATYNIKIQFRTVVGIEFGYIPCLE